MQANCFGRAILTPFCACILEMTDKGGDSAPTEQSHEAQFDATATLPWVPEFERRSRDRVTTYRRQSFHRSYRTHCSRNSPFLNLTTFRTLFTHHCPTCRHVKLRKQTDPTKNRFDQLSCFKITWKCGS